MEYEKKFWIKSHVPTGLGMWPKRKKRKVIREEHYKDIKKLLDDGKTFKEIGLIMGVSWHTIKKIKEIL